MSTSLSQNAFGIIPIKGEMDLKGGSSNVVSCRVYGSEAVALIPGQAVKLYDSGNGVPIVTTCTADTDDVFGFVAFNPKNQSFAADAAVEIALVGAVQWMQASGSIGWGQRLMAVISGQKVAVRTANVKKTVVGIALGHVTDGQLLRVLIQTPSPFYAASFTDLADAPSTLVSGDYIKVNAGATALVNSAT